jgi:hypothetical protein
MDELVEQTSPRNVLRALVNLPKGVHETYNCLFRRIEASPRAEEIRRFIAVIARAMSPLSVSALEQAMAVQPGQTELDDLERVNVRLLISMSAGLVELDRMESVRFAHQTAYDYIGHQEHEIFRNSQKSLAVTCLSFLQLSDFA